MTTPDKIELNELRSEISKILFRSTVMGGIQANKQITYDYNKGDLDTLRAYARLMTIHNDPFHIIATARILQDHGGRYVITVLSEDHVKAYLAVKEAQDTQALHSGKLQRDSDMHNGREVCAIVLKNLSLQAAVTSIIVDRGIVDSAEIRKLLADMGEVPRALSSGVL